VTIAEQLRGRGHTVLEACSSEEAVALVMQRPEESPVQAILLDINMPDMDGWEMLKRLTRSPETANIPLVLLSVLPPPESANGAKQKEWIEKSLYEGRLFAELGLALNRGTGSARVLLVEDDEDLASVVIAGFEKTEVRVEHASTAKQAMLACQRCRPDLMILDLRLPDGDGFSLVDWLRSQPELKALPLVVYSGREVSPDEREKLRLGPTKFLTKARVQTHDVEDLVLAMVHRRRLRRADDFKVSKPGHGAANKEFDSPHGSHS
jgi:CheY-like chemotaxis protein